MPSLQDKVHALAMTAAVGGVLTLAYQAIKAKGAVEPPPPPPSPPFCTSSPVPPQRRIVRKGSFCPEPNTPSTVPQQVGLVLPIGCLYESSLVLPSLQTLLFLPLRESTCMDQLRTSTA